MLKRFKLLSLAAFVIAAALSSCQKQEMESFSNEAVSSDGTRASSFSPKFGIDWDSVTAERPGSSLSAISSFRATFDNDYLYMLVKVDASQLSTGSTHHYDNFLTVYLKDSGSSSTNWTDKGKKIDKLCGWLITDQSPKFTYWGSDVKYQCVNVSGTIYNEIRFPRSLDPLLQKSTIKLGVTLSDRYYRYDESYSSRNNLIGCIPSKGKGMYSVQASGSTSTTTTTNPSNGSSSNHCSDIGKKPMLMAYVPYYYSVPTSDDAKKLTHINYFNGKIGSDGSISIQGGSSRIKSVLDLKYRNSNLKVVLTIGGSGSNDMFKQLFNSDNILYKFCESCESIVNTGYKTDHGTYYFDGIDIDWEGLKLNDQTQKDRFNRLVRKVREYIGSKKIISVAAPSSPGAIDWKTAMTYVDYVNVMSYDMSWSDPYVYHHSALYPSSSFTKKDGSGYYHSCSAVVKAYKDAGVSLSKQNMGVAFYGRGTSEYNIVVDGSTKKAKDGLGYYLLSKIPNSGYEHWDSKAMVPYRRKSSDFFGFENKYSVNIKGQYAKKNGLLGVMCWDYGQDKNHELLDAMKKGLEGSNIGGNSVQSSLPLTK